MPAVQAMLSSHPHPPAAVELLSRCVEACFTCAETCNACADACLGEPEAPHLIACIRLNLDCATICTATGTILARSNADNIDRTMVQAQIAACMVASRACAEECARHGEMHHHCRICAEACALCEQACADILRTVKIS